MVAGNDTVQSRGRCSPTNPEDPLDAVYKAFRDDWLMGNNPDPDAFCEEHPEIGPELKEKLYDFCFVAEAFPSEKIVPAEDLNEVLAEGTVPSGMLIGDFKIVGEIRRGAMGNVYEAEQISLRRRVALKVLAPHLSLTNSDILRFRREAKALARQHHPGIVAVYGAGHQKGLHYIAQELVEGGSNLSDRLDELRSTREPPGDEEYYRGAADLIAQVADALEHAHNAKVVHRDVKPSNILLDESGQPKLSDFGLAKVQDALSLSRTGDFSGTPYYMSPEQAMSRRIPIDHRTDIFSLGVTLYELLTLELPFTGDSTYEVLRKIILHDPKDPRKVNPHVPRDLAVITMKALDKNPERRYATMEAFARALRAYLADEPLDFHPPNLIVKTLRRIGRNPVPSIAVAVAVFAILSLILVLATGPGKEDPPLVPAAKNAISMEIKLYEGDSLTAQGYIGVQAEYALCNDLVDVIVELSDPAYCYLIACNPDGSVQLCHPQDPGASPERIEKVVYPQDPRDSYQLTDGAGAQAFALVASHEPLPPYESWRTGFPWKPTELKDPWRFDGKEFRSLRLLTRGTVTRRESEKPKPFEEIVDYLRKLPGVDDVVAVAFPVEEEEEEREKD